MLVFKSIDEPEVAKLIKDGQVGVLPTDTIYGLVADASNQAACERLYKLKSREHKPGTIIAASIDQLVELGLERRYLKAVEQFWPGSVSVIIPADTELAYLHLDKVSLACRIPSDSVMSKLLYKSGPLLTTSANQPGHQPACNIKEAQAYFGENVNFYVDGGNFKDRPPSTIIRIVDDVVEVLREGAVNIDEGSGAIIE